TSAGGRDRGGADQSAEPVAGASDLGRAGRLGDELLSLAARGGVPPSWGRALRAAAAAGHPIRGAARGASSGAGVCLVPSGGASPGVGLANGGRRHHLSQPFDGVPDSAGREAGLPLATADEAEPGSRGAGPAAESALGHRATAPA